jgi:poly(beta-D-mannuronate) lyase
MNLRLPLIASALLIFLGVPCRADRLKSPWDTTALPLTDAPYACPDPPPFSRSLDTEGYYIDAHHSVIDPAKREAYEKASAPPTHLGQWTTQAADAYLRHGSRAAAQCVYTLLSAAAAARA